MVGTLHDHHDRLIRLDAIAAIVAVLARAYASNPSVDASLAALAVQRIKDFVAKARKYFGPPPTPQV